MNDVSAPFVTLAPGPSARPEPVAERQTKIAVRNLDFHYGKVHALKAVSLPIAERQVTAIIGPSGCGKSTLLRALNRIY